jgi:hypothetical protein
VIRVRGYRSIIWTGLAERAPHPNPLRASFARLDPAKSGARENCDPALKLAMKAP